MSTPTLGVRGELRADGDCCAGCRARLADHADLERIEVPNGVDLLALCVRCGQPTVIPWIREAA